MKYCDHFFYCQFFGFVHCCHFDRFLFLSVFLDQFLREVCPAYQFFLIRTSIEDDSFLASLIVQVSVSDTYCSVQGTEHVCSHIQICFPDIGLYVLPEGFVEPVNLNVYRNDCINFFRFMWMQCLLYCQLSRNVPFLFLLCFQEFCIIQSKLSGIF